MMQFGILPKYEAQIVKESIQMDFTLILIDLEKKWIVNLIDLE